MAVLASIASGNFTAAATWGLVNPTSYNALQTTGNTFNTSYTATNRTTAFTPGAITVSHIGFKLSNRTGTTGTLKLHIALNATHVEVAGTEVTINTADLPVAATADANGGWHFLKLDTPVTLAAATAYEVEGKTSNSNQVTPYASTNVANFSIALITTTTQAPVAGDDMIIAGEYTGAGTSNSFTVTMDEEATTDYGSAPTAANSLLTPGIAVCNKGTLTWGTTAAKNYNLKLSNSLIVYSGGILNMGTTGTACPRDSTMTLQFDPGTNVDYGLVIRNLGTFVSQGQSRTSGKNIYYCYLNTDEAIASTSLGVDTDTGWLDNDEIAVASTTRTAANCEAGTLNGNAGASTLTVDGFLGAGGGLAVAHSGTSPTQAEVILLTRNIVIRGASTTLQAYVVFEATSQVDIDWIEFKWMGSATTGKRGVNVHTTTGSCNIQYSSFHDFRVASSMGVLFVAASGTGFTFSNNVIWNIANVMFQANSTSTGTWTVSNSFFIRNTDSNLQGVSLNDVGGTFTGNTIVGSAGVGIYASENAVLGTFNTLVIHSTTGTGFQSNANILGTITTLTVWRSSSAGVTLSAGDLTIDSLTAFGNTTNNVLFNGSGVLTLISPVLSGDTTFSTTNGVNLGGASATGVLTVYNGDFSTVTGIKTAHTNDLTTVSGPTYANVKLINTKLGAATELAGQSSMLTSSIVSSQKHDQTTATHKTWRRYGTIEISTTQAQADTKSMKMTPNNASFKLESSGHFGGFKVPVLSGQTCTPTVYVFEDATYNGARARLILKRNDAIGFSETVIDTATAASDLAWEALTGTTAAATDDGTMEFIIDIDGTAGSVYVDSFSATVT